MGRQMVDQLLSLPPDPQNDPGPQNNEEELFGEKQLEEIWRNIIGKDIAN